MPYKADQEVIDHTEHLRRFVPIGPAFAFFIGLFHTFDRNKGHRAVPIGPQKTGRQSHFPLEKTSAGRPAARLQGD